MKDKRLELKLSVRGDGSLSRNNLRSSTRSNRSNLSNSSSNLPVSEIFATDRFGAPQHRAFEILDKYRRQPVQYGYPAQSLQALNRYQQSNRYGSNSQSNSHLDPNIVRQNVTQYPVSSYDYQPVYADPASQIYGTLPRTAQYTRQKSIQNPIYYTLPERSPRRVRISENEPIVYDYGTLLFTHKEYVIYS
ncbi:unnamed protein product [Euphydryas editha]|uniref:Uncharacterized protein n=1 Tax=Euphydryas editha TaxID=104508 RepID=A0AAU9TD13_EUPED|nr:unnamed protein product [Euphydryas editha]